MTRSFIVAGAAAGFICAASAARADTSIADVAFASSTFFLILSGLLVMWMAAGFTMLEAGFVRARNVATQLTKNFGLFVVASAAFSLIGYAMQNPEGVWLIEGVLSGATPGANGVERAGTSIDADDGALVTGGSFFLFQLMFCAAAASIMSGAMAERVRLWPFFAFVAVLTGLIYPIQASWTWGGGMLASIGFVDHAGSVVVHTVGGWAALAGVIILGPRLGRYAGGRLNPMPGSSLPLSTLGVFVLWLGWFGFNGGSAIASGSISGVFDLSRAIVNTNAAAGGGALAAMLLTQLIFKKIDLTMVLNGALAGLVSITAEPIAPTMTLSWLIGAGGGALVVFVVPLLDKLEVDDVVGAIPVHLCAGIWGGIVAGLTNPEGSVVAQLLGIAIVGAFVFVSSVIALFLINATMGLRCTPEAEREGLDINQLGMEAYPDFVTYEDEV